MKKITLIIACLIAIAGTAQTYTHRDSLHGSLRPERTCFDVLHYGLNITIDPEKKYIFGYNNIIFNVVQPTLKIQVDLFENMRVDSIVYNRQRLSYTRDNDAVFISFPATLAIGTEQSIRFYYSGSPTIARNAPWDGGFVFTSDTAGKPWVGVAVQGTGASLWYPVKDHQSDEPDNGATIQVAVPNGLMDVSNGRFMGSTNLNNGYTRWDWQVVNPINNYDITVNIADYAHIHDTYNGLDLDYYVLRANEDKARIQFEEVKPMMECFQAKFGGYPFKEDGYKLVETPYLGMEHQSAVAYGNHYNKGYLGNDLSHTGIGLSFDYIVVHESGHEWFGNSITSSDIADMWIHEGFTTYSESVYVECHQGYKKAMEYINGEEHNSLNRKPIIGIYGINKEGSGDMYFKGALMLNTLRHIVNDDTKWWKLIYDYATTYKHKVIDTQTVIDFFNVQTGLNLTPVFNQYLRHAALPVLQLQLNDKYLEYRWLTNEPGFTMPVELIVNNKPVRVTATNNWQQLNTKVKNLNAIDVATNKFYIKTEKL